MSEYKMQGNCLKVEHDPCGLKVTYGAQTAPWSRVAHPTVCLTDDIGVTAKLDGVTISQDSDYSLGTMPTDILSFTVKAVNVPWWLPHPRSAILTTLMSSFPKSVSL